MGKPNRNRNGRLRADARQAKVAAALSYWRDSFAGLQKDESPAGQGEALKTKSDSSELHSQDSTGQALYHPLRWRGE